MKVAVSGFDLSSLEALGDSSISIHHFPALSQLLSVSQSSKLKQLLQDLNNYDWWIIRLSGDNPREFIQHLKFHGLLRHFSERKFKAAYWTMDSHHMWPHETAVAHMFDHVFVAHSPYMNKFRGANVSFLPCAYSLAEPNLDISSVKSEGPFDPLVISPFRIYPLARRNLIHFRLMNELDRKGISFFFGEIPTGNSFPRIRLIEAMRDSKIILNLSLADDLNMRFFEALALNKVVVANRVSDIGFLERFSGNILVGKNDAESIAELIDVALLNSPESSGDVIRTQHSLDYRLWEALTHLGVKASEPKYGPVKPMILGPKSDISNNLSHKSSKLLGFSPLVSIRPKDLVWLLKNDGLLGLAEFFGYAGLSLIIWGGSRLFRYFPAVRRLANRFSIKSNGSQI